MTTQEELLNICYNVRYLRKRHHLSRTVMAKRLGIRIATLDFIEADIWPERTSVRLLFRIHHYFGIPPKTILTDRLHDFQTESCIQLQSHP